MNNKELNELLLKVNRICYGDSFKSAFTKEFHYLPSGLTYHIYENKLKNTLEFNPCIKHYGYEHSFNNGIAEFSDAYDFDIGNSSQLSEENKKFMFNWFKENEKEFYNKYMKNSVVY